MLHRPPRLFDKLRTDYADVGVRVLMVQRRVQSNLTQQTPEQVIASLNHDTTASQPLADVFNKTAVHQNLADIQAITSAIGSVSAEYKGWATVDARIAQLSAELKFKELNEQATQKQKELTKTQADINAAHSDGSAVTPEELAQLKQLTDQLNQINLLSLGQKQTYDTSQAQIDQWSPNGSKGKYLTSITNALTTQLTGQTPYAALFAGARNLLAEQLHDQETAERVIGHALIACTVAIVSGTHCGTAAAGATASVAIADNFANLFTKQPNGQYSNQQKEAISALTTIAIGIATAATGGDTMQAYTAADAAKNQTENNDLAWESAVEIANAGSEGGKSITKPLIDLLKKYYATGDLPPEKVAELERMYQQNQNEIDTMCSVNPAVCASMLRGALAGQPFDNVYDAALYALPGGELTMMFKFGAAGSLAKQAANAHRAGNVAEAKELLKRAQILEGIYVADLKVQQYVGQSGSLIQRITNHFSTKGKLTSYDLDQITFHFMPNSTKLEREVYEQYVVTELKGVTPLLNKVNPMGGRKELYESMIDDVIKKYNLPMYK